MTNRHRSLAALLGVAGVLVASAVFASGATAMAPARIDHTATGSVTIAAGALCGFPILLEGTQTWTSTLFYDQNGLISKDFAQGTEQDTFSANGKTLQGDSYPFSFIVDYVDGVSVDSHGVGVAERVRLPNGGAYVVAGRVDTFSANGPILTVDSGDSGTNLDAFCAALS